jgi:hypothetical protein
MSNSGIDHWYRLKEYEAEEYWHYDIITKKSEEQLIESYLKWAKEKGYHQSQDKAVKIYALAKEGIPTVSSDTPSTKMLVQETVWVLREVDNTLMTILTQMQALAKSLPEYPVVTTGYRRTRHGEQQLELRFDGIAGCLRMPEGGSSKQYLVVKKMMKFMLAY